MSSAHVGSAIAGGADPVRGQARGGPLVRGIWLLLLLLLLSLLSLLVLVRSQ